MTGHLDAERRVTVRDGGLPFAPMTHEYTLLLGGVIMPGSDTPEPTALAWAHDTVLAVGSDAAVRSISRGDSRMVQLRGLAVVPGPGMAILEPGSTASFDVVDSTAHIVARVRHGRVVSSEVDGLDEAPPTTRR